MFKEAKILHDQVNELYQEMLPLLEGLEKRIVEDQDRFGIDQADAAYACRETKNILEALEKRINEVARAAKVVVNYYLTAANQTKVRTEYCTVSTKPRLWFKIPSKREKDPEFYDELLKFSGLDPEMCEKEGVRIHGPGLMDMITEAIGNGEPVPVDPKEVVKTELDLNIRKRKDV